MTFAGGSSGTNDAFAPHVSSRCSDADASVRDRSVAAPRRAALLLDRDGVVNVDHGYVCRIDQVTFVTGIFTLCRAAQARGLAVVIVTNQSGIGRGYFSEAEFRRLSAWMIDAFALEGVCIEAIYFCPHRPDEACSCRKPQPGLIVAAAEELGLDLAVSVLVGDSERDVEAARRAGVGRAYRVGPTPLLSLGDVAAAL